MDRLERLRKKLDWGWWEIESELQIEITEKMINLIEAQIGMFNTYMREVERNNIELLDQAFTPRLKKMLQTKIDERDNDERNSTEYNETFYKRSDTERNKQHTIND
tara:strand:+ start:3927 stop:4244 length:318 start_codon:yes stop_codon:yes gene_type:complete